MTMKYVATFFSHYSASLTKRKLDKEKVEAKLAPTPRKVSSSCGTCLIYLSDEPKKEFMDSDFEAIFLYKEESDTYEKAISNE